MKIIVAVFLAAFSASAISQEVKVQLMSRQQPTAARVADPNGRFEPFKIPHRSVFKVDHVVLHEFQGQSSDGRPCSVMAYVKEQELKLDDAQLSEVAGACDEGYASAAGAKELRDREERIVKDRLARLKYAGDAPSWLNQEELGERKSILAAVGYLDLGAGVGAIDKVKNRRHTMISPYKAGMMYYTNLRACQQTFGSLEYSKAANACATGVVDGFAEYLRAYKNERFSDEAIDSCMRESGFSRAYDFDAWGSCISQSSASN